MWRVECYSIVKEREEGFLTPRTAFGMTIYMWSSTLARG